MAAGTQPATLPKHIFQVNLEEEGHKYSRISNGLWIPSVTQIIESVGLFEKNVVFAAAMARKSPIGSEVHRATAMYDQGEDIFRDYDLDSRVEGYCESYAKLKKASGFQPYLVEFGPYGAELSGMQVGFKLDRVGSLNKREAIVELKTTAEEEPHHGVQLAGYDLCLGGGRRVRAVFQLFPDGKMGKIHPYEEENDYNAFLYALWLEWWKRNKGVKRG